MQSDGQQQERGRGSRRLFLNDHGARDPHSPLHPASPLRSLSAARRSLSASRECTEGERLLVKSVSPHESIGGRGAGVVRTLETRGRSIVARRAADSSHALIDGNLAAPLKRRPNSAQLNSARCVASQSGPPKDPLDAHARPPDARPHTAPRLRQSRLGQEEEQDRKACQKFQRKLRVPEEGFERRRGYFASLGSNAPGAPLHPSFDSVGTSPQGSPRRSLSPACTLSMSSLPLLRATSPRLQISAPNRTSSLPSEPVQAKSRSEDISGRRPSSARHGPNFKRYWSNGGARQPGTSLHPRHDIPPELRLSGGRQDSHGTQRNTTGNIHGVEANSKSFSTVDFSRDKYWVDEGARRPGSPLHPAHKTLHFPRAPIWPHAPTRGRMSMPSDSRSFGNVTEADNTQHATGSMESRCESPRINVFASQLGGMQPNTPLSPSLSPRSSPREDSAFSVCNDLSGKKPAFEANASNENRIRGYAVGNTAPGERMPGSPLHPANPHDLSRSFSAQSSHHRPKNPTRLENEEKVFRPDPPGNSEKASAKEAKIRDSSPGLSDELRTKQKAAEILVHEKTSELTRALLSFKVSRGQDLEKMTESLQLVADWKDVQLREAWRVQEENDAAQSWYACVMQELGAHGGVQKHHSNLSMSHKIWLPMAPPDGVHHNEGTKDCDVGKKPRDTVGDKIWERLVDSGWSSRLSRGQAPEDRPSVNLFDVDTETRVEGRMKKLQGASYKQKLPLPPYRYDCRRLYLQSAMQNAKASPCTFVRTFVRMHRNLHAMSARFIHTNKSHERCASPHVFESLSSISRERCAQSMFMLSFE